VVTVFFREGTDRLLVPYLPAASILMAAGLPPIAEWITGRLRRPGLSTVTVCLIVIGVMALPPLIKMARHIGREGSHYPPEYRPVAATIRQESDTGTIPVVMADNPAPGFWAGGRTVAIPATDKLSELVGQMDRFEARFLVVSRDLDSGDSAGVAVLGNPGNHPGLELVKTFSGKIDLYRRTRHSELRERVE
jgi:hypothetical protein